MASRIINFTSSPGDQKMGCTSFRPCLGGKRIRESESFVGSLILFIFFCFFCQCLVWPKNKPNDDISGLLLQFKKLNKHHISRSPLYQNRWVFGKVPRGGGVISIVKFILILDLQTGFFEHNFLKKFAISFFENEGGGVKNSSVLVPSFVP